MNKRFIAVLPEDSRTAISLILSILVVPSKTLVPSGPRNISPKLSPKIPLPRGEAHSVFDNSPHAED
jgi:hypothetical protein